MKIVIVGASGTMGTHLSKAFEKDNEIVRADRNSVDVQVDITSPESVEKMYKQIGSFDALICTAGPTYVGPWKNLNEETFRTAIKICFRCAYQT